MEDIELVTVAVFTYPHEAYALLGRLEAEGVFCFLENENIVSANPLYSNAVGGIQIRVKKENEQKALEIIAETQKSINNNFSAELPSDEEITSLPIEATNFTFKQLYRVFLIILICAFILAALVFVKN